MKFTGETDDKAPIHCEGTFLGTVIGAEVKATKTDKEMIVLSWKTSEGKLRSYHTYVPEYPFILLKPMVALGIDEAWLTAEETSLEDVALECLKRKALLEVVHGDYQGNPTASVDGVNPVPNNAPKPKPEPKVVRVVEEAAEDDENEPF